MKEAREMLWVAYVNPVGKCCLTQDTTNSHRNRVSAEIQNDEISKQALETGRTLNAIILLSRIS